MNLTRLTPDNFPLNPLTYWPLKQLEFNYSQEGRNMKRMEEFLACRFFSCLSAFRYEFRSRRTKIPRGRRRISGHRYLSSFSGDICFCSAKRAGVRMLIYVFHLYSEYHFSTFQPVDTRRFCALCEDILQFCRHSGLPVLGEIRAVVGELRF